MAKPARTKDKEPRKNAYTVRYSESEDALVSAAAAESSLETGSWIRMVSVQAARAQAGNAAAPADAERKGRR